MNDEIKEILEEIDNKIIPNEHWNKIKDYITNLQEENEKVHKDFSELSERYFFTKSRCEKAIKYIEQEAVFYDSYDGEDTMLEELCERYYKELLNILNGGDEDEENKKRN